MKVLALTENPSMCWYKEVTKHQNPNNFKKSFEDFRGARSGLIGVGSVGSVFGPSNVSRHPNFLKGFKGSSCRGVL